MPLLPVDHEPFHMNPGEPSSPRIELIYDLEKEVHRLEDVYQEVVDALCDDIVKSEGEDEIRLSIEQRTGVLIDIKESQRLCYAQIEDLIPRRHPCTVPPMKKRPNCCDEIECECCGAKNEIDAQFCKICASPIDMGDIWRYCKKCRIAYSREINFCPECGSPITVEIKRKRK